MTALGQWLRRLTRSERTLIGTAVASQIVDPGRIAALLQQLVEDRALVDVQVERVEGQFSSALLKVSGRDRSIAIDELNPVEGHRAVTAGTLLRVRGRVEGVEIRFRTRVNEISKASGIAYYRADLPAELRHVQRRDAVRVKVSAESLIPVHLYGLLGFPLHGDLRDISTDGCSVRVHSSTGMVPRRGVRFPECSIELPGAPRVASEVEVRHVETQGRAGHFELGCRFVDLPRDQRRSVERFIATTQRDRIRRYRRVSAAASG